MSSKFAILILNPSTYTRRQTDDGFGCEMGLALTVRSARAPKWEFAGCCFDDTILKEEETVITLYLREARRIPQEDVVDHGR